MSRTLRGRGGAAAGRAGFTLVELTAVFGILALIAVVAVPAFRRWVQEDDLSLATRRIEALLTVARDSAIRGGAPVSIVIDSVSGMVWLDALTSGDEVEPLALPAGAESMAAAPWTRAATPATALDPEAAQGTSLELPPSVVLEVSRARARFTFAPGGAAYADTLVLRTVTQARMVSLDPWTGDVVVR